MPKFKNIGPAVYIGKPGSYGTRAADADEVVEIPGRLITTRDKDDDRPLPDDAYIVADRDGDERAWAHSQWELVQDKAKATDKTADKADPAKEN